MAYSKFKKSGYKKSWGKPEIKFDESFYEKDFQFTDYHTAIQKSVKNGGNTLVNAGPGSGKTTTIFRAILPALIEKYGEGADGMINAFNAKNAGEFKTKINPDYTGIKAGTIHSCLLDILKNGGDFKYSKVNGPQKAGERNGRYQSEKSGKIREMADALFPEETTFFRAKITQAINLARNNAFGIPGWPEINDRGAWEDLIARHSLNGSENEGIEDENTDGPDLIEASMQLFIESLKNKSEIDFCDMLYFPLYYGVEIPKMDFVIMDEGQDIFPITLEFLIRAKNKGAQIIMVGDRNQAINSFAGSINNAFDIAAEKLDGVILSMPVSYRCSHIAAKFANNVFLDSVIPHENANIGEEIHISFGEFCEKVPDLDKNDVVLSRTHKNLIPFAMDFIKKGKRFVYKGIRDWANKANRSLYHAAKMGKDLTTIRQNLSEHQNELEDKYFGRAKMPKWVIESGETIETLCLLIAGIETEGGDFQTVKKYIKTLIEADNDNRDCITLSTIHASKGGEWQNVYFCGPLQSALAKTEAELNAEKCVEFVAYTRSSDKLIFVQEGK